MICTLQRLPMRVWAAARSSSQSVHFPLPCRALTARSCSTARPEAVDHDDIDSGSAIVPDNDPVVLAVSLLRRNGGRMHPAALVTRMRAEWRGDPRQMPAGIGFAKSFPGIFELHWISKRAGSGDGSVLQRNVEAIVLKPLAASGAVQRTSCPDAKVWAPIIREELQAAGGVLPVHDVQLRLQQVALQRGLMLPPSGVSWIVLSKEPLYQNFRAVWAPELSSCGRTAVQAIELVEKPALQYDFAELRKLAAELEVRDAQTADKPHQAADNSSQPRPERLR